MAYPITTTAGATLATIADGTVNSTATSLTLIGKNYAGYGNFLNENYVQLLENFSNSTAPAHAIRGQLWYDSSVLTLKVYDGTLWKPISSSAASSTAPLNPVTGDLWWDTTNLQLKVWSGTAWVTIGPTYTATSGISGAIVETILDSSSNGHLVVKFYLEDTAIAILSKDSLFTPQTAISGFTTIIPGLNLISSSTLTGSQFTGDVNNALTLSGILASQFLRSDQNTSTAYSITAGAGVTIGSDLNIVPTPTTNEVQLNNTTLDRDINIYVNKGNTKTRSIGIYGANASVAFSNAISVGGTMSVQGAVTLANTLSITGQGILSSLVPTSGNLTGTIGAITSQFNSIYAQTFYGNLIATTITLDAGGTNVVASTTYVQNWVNRTGFNSQGVKYVSTSTPTGGNNGDVWYRI
jgi:hypothetical protein